MNNINAQALLATFAQQQAQQVQIPAIQQFEQSQLTVSDNDDNNNSNSLPYDTSLSSASKKHIQKRKKYRRIDDEIRLKLVEAVEKNGEMLKTAAARYNVNYSSAKSIFHTYRKEGRVIKKSIRERNKNKKVQSSSPVEQPSTASPSSSCNNQLTAMQSEVSKVSNNSPAPLTAATPALSNTALSLMALLQQNQQQQQQQQAQINLINMMNQQQQQQQQQQKVQMMASLLQKLGQVKNGNVNNTGFFGFNN